MKTQISLITLLTLAISISASGQSYTGPEGSNWATASNWDTGLPTSGDNVHIAVPGPVVSSPGAEANIIFVRGATPSSTITIESNGALSASGMRIGFNDPGTAEVTVRGTFTVGDIYLAQSAGTDGSKLILESGTINNASTLRLGFEATGILEVMGGTLNANNIFVAQKTGSGGSMATLSGGTVNTTGSLIIGFEDEGSVHITDEDVNIDIAGFTFGRNAAALLEYVLTPGGNTSVMNVGSINLGNEVTRTLRVDASAVTDLGSLTTIVLFRSTADPFTQDQLGILNDSLELVSLTEDFNLALADGGMDIVLTAEAQTPTWAGYPIESDESVNTGIFLGWLYVGNAPWVYSYSLNGWIYAEESALSTAGAWIYAPK